MARWLKVYIVVALLLATFAIITAIEARRPVVSMLYTPEGRYSSAQDANAYWSRVWSFGLLLWLAGGAIVYIVKR